MKSNIVLRPNTNSRKIPGFHCYKIQPQTTFTDTFLDIMPNFIPNETKIFIPRNSP